MSDPTRLFLILLLVAIAATSSLTALIIVAVQSRKKSSWYWPMPDAIQPHEPPKKGVRIALPRAYAKG